MKSFFKEEILDKGKEIFCDKCKRKIKAYKKLNLYKFPRILVLV